MNISVDINDLIDIQCPQTTNTTEGRLKAQYLKFMQVSYQGYEQCSLSARNRHLLSCNRPFVQNRLTLLFQEHTPYPRGPTFNHDEEYYFITTSNGTENGIDNTSGGLCATHNMKLRVYVKPKPTVPATTGTPTSSTIRSNSTPPDTSRPVTSATTRTTTRETTTLRTTTTKATTTRKTTQYTTGGQSSTTPETNDIGDNMTRGRADRRHVSTTLLLVSLLVAVVRWLHP
ncbi:ephrin-B2-like [Lytechinus variegatus]|uniref:ephrin-B2-like n=1 Tax=Lytechinus variegatus TaxID=7654 RepID=UPI001BB1E3D7|nr:ephrin-B2-like [Lytechinus variegatus]